MESTFWVFIFHNLLAIFIYPETLVFNGMSSSFFPSSSCLWLSLSFVSNLFFRPSGYMLKADPSALRFFLFACCHTPVFLKWLFLVTPLIHLCLFISVTIIMDNFFLLTTIVVTSVLQIFPLMGIGFFLSNHSIPYVSSMPYLLFRCPNFLF